MDSYYKNPLSSISFKNYKDNFRKLKEEFKDYDKILDANSYRFKGIHIDKYHADIKNKIDLLKKLYQYIEKIMTYKKYNGYN